MHDSLEIFIYLFHEYISIKILLHKTGYCLFCELREFDVLCLPSIREFQAKEIKACDFNSLEFEGIKIRAQGIQNSQ